VVDATITFGNPTDSANYVNTITTNSSSVYTQSPSGFNFGASTGAETSSGGDSNDDKDCDDTCVGLAVGLTLGLGLPLILFVVYWFFFKDDSGSGGDQNIVEMERPEG